MSNKLEAALGGAEGMYPVWPENIPMVRTGNPWEAQPEPKPFAPYIEAEPTANTFTDSQGDTFTATQSLYGDDDILTLAVQDTDAEVIFFKADATKIIALIAEAAK